MAWRSPAEGNLHTLFRRCVECPPEQPSCPPSCTADETCSLVPQSCSSCASMVCVKVGTIPGQVAPSQPTPIGGIIGGVIAGVVAIILGTYLIWRFCIRKKRRVDLWEPPEKNTLGRSGTLLSRTNSIASTVLTRASNVIQIAYIPGVTVRSPSESPAIPQIPSVYANSSGHTSPHQEQDQDLFFSARDLRASVWSDTTSISENRISLAPSLARASVATTLYGQDAIVPPIPAQYAARAQPSVVSVKSGPGTPKGSATPPMPQVPKLTTINGSSIVARNVTARPIEVKKIGSGNSVPTLSNLARQNSKKNGSVVTETEIQAYSDEKEVVVTRGAPMSRPNPSYTSVNAESASGVSAIIPADGPLASNSNSTSKPRPDSSVSMMIAEAMRAATQANVHHAPMPSMRPDSSSGPFSDANEVKDNRF